MVKKDDRKRSTYRFNQELEEIIKREASRLGISKNVKSYTKEEAEKYISKMADLHYQGRKSAGSVAMEYFGADSGHKVNRSAEVMFEDAEEARLISELGGVRFGKYTAALVLYEEDLDVLNEKVKIVKSVINNMNFLNPRN